LEEEWLQVNGGAITRNFVDKVLNMRLKSAKVGNLVLDEIWSDKGL
jgi:hypothetical protein